MKATRKQLEELRAEWIRLYKKATESDKGRKWYASDLAEFIKAVNACTDIQRMQTAIGHLRWQTSQQAQRFHDKEVNRMARAGMFNPAKMGPKNALD